MEALYVVTVVALILSAIFNKQKTIKGLKIAWKKFSKILSSYIKLLILISIVLLLTDKFIIQYLGGSSQGIGLLMGLVLGSITIMPGFIAYPLAGVLVEKGVSYMVITAFITTLMMVGVVTYPVEKEYLGTKATILRNVASLIIALIIALTAGLLYGEGF